MTQANHLSFDDVSRLTAAAEEFNRQGDQYLCVRIRESHMQSYQTDPLRLDCLAVLLCRRGALTANVNLKEYTVRTNSVLVVQPGSLVQMEFANGGRLDMTMLFISTDCLRNINIDINAINIRSLAENRSPIMPLDETEFTRLTRIFELLALTAGDDATPADPFERGLSRSLVGAVFYQLLHSAFVRINADNADTEPSGRRATYVHQFMRLVHLNYTRQRTVAFYATRMCITPKYLTVVIKELTGRSPADWINDFVIIEAKNLLRYSGKNIQQVSNELNFTNQSAFGKYFKHLTGMSPSDYQKS